MHLTNYTSQPDFSLVPDAAKHPLTNADFIVLTLDLRTKFEVAQRTYFATQPDEFFENQKDSSKKKPGKPIDETFYPLKADILTDISMQKK